MARGVIYSITRDRIADIGYSRAGCQQEPGAMDFDYIRFLKECMLGLGAAVGQDHSDEDYVFFFRFEDARKAKLAYFEPRFNEFKQKTEALTLDSVLEAPPAFDHILDDGYSSMVILQENGCTMNMTLDGFIRRMESNVTYYVYGKVQPIYL